MADAAAVSSAPGPEEDAAFAFEGPEKVLELDLVVSEAFPRGARDIPRATLDTILTEAKCKILSAVSTENLDAYVLSESSLFVYVNKFVIKTCGTTTLLRILPHLLPALHELNISVEWVGYTRKDFSRPDVQVFPHTSFVDEVKYAQAFFPEGSGYMLGPVTKDHWVVFVADYTERAVVTATDRTLNVMMYGLHPDSCGLFFQEEGGEDRTEEATTRSGIRSLLPGSIIQDFMFSPCGYSMNGILDDAYWTIHITPESHCSYASFETNLRGESYNALVKAVLDIFRPQRFTVTLFADEGGLADMRDDLFDMSVIVMRDDEPRVQQSGAEEGGAVVLDTEEGAESPSAPGDSHGSGGLDEPVAGDMAAAPRESAPRAAQRLANEGKWVYQRGAKCQTQFEGDYCSTMANWALIRAGPRRQEPRINAAPALPPPVAPLKGGIIRNATCDVSGDGS